MGAIILSVVRETERVSYMKADNKRKLYAGIALLLCSFIWGNAFVAQSVGMDYVGPFTFQSVRSFIGSASLIPVLAFMHFKRGNKDSQKKDIERRTVITGGTLCGIALCAASCFQQVGIQYTTVGKAGFITAMYIILVPVLSVFLKKKIPSKIWLCIILAAVGLYFLSMKGTDLSISRGDGYMVICAFLFSIQILLVDHYAPKADAVWLACIQFFVSGTLSAIPMFMFEHPAAAALEACMIPLLYAGVMSCGVAYTLQIVGQKYSEASTASLLMSLESVFSLLGGIVLLRQIPSPRELIGCALVFAAVIWSQL